jgi:dipeptidyl aminopeptidase/acylaminoacyl peptidase
MLVADGIPPAPAGLRERIAPYLESRAASFQGWHPSRREMLILTRFADSMQVHSVERPGGARRQWTFSPEPVASARYRPVTGDAVLLSQDSGGGEFFQLYLRDVATGRTTRLTDGKSRNTGATWSRAGKEVAWASTQRNGKDTDIWVMDPDKPGSARMAWERKGGGWQVMDWSPDGRSLLVLEYVSINESWIHVLDVASGAARLLTPREGKVSHADARFSADGRRVFCTSDGGGEFRGLTVIDVGTGKREAWLRDLPWDVEALEASPDGKWLAVASNEDGVSVLRLVDARTGKEKRRASIPKGVVTGMEWHASGRELGFTLSHARSPADAHSWDARTGAVTRWTESEAGGMDTGRFAEPETIRVRGFDGTNVSGFLYRPDARRFPGPRPVLVVIHGGPESQSRPVFLGRNNYWLEEMGVALMYPNVRGSAGYGKTFLLLDNGALRENSVKDIGSFLDWIGTDKGLDAGRVAVTGGSYGGYMTLASLVHYSPRLRCGVDIVGISSFVTFLERTQDYRKDLRRAEYGDERDPAMRELLGRISPLTRVRDIRVPLMVVQGLNDPRVPAGEAEQIVKAMRDAGGECWYLLAKDEGHGFAKKRNVDFQFLSTVQFLGKHLVAPGTR